MSQHQHRQVRLLNRMIQAADAVEIMKRDWLPVDALIGQIGFPRVELRLPVWDLFTETLFSRGDAVTHRLDL